jgi:hypothetical protein
MAVSMAHIMPVHAGALNSVLEIRNGRTSLAVPHALTADSMTSSAAYAHAKPTAR